MVVAAIGVAAMSADARSQLRKYRNQPVMAAFCEGGAFAPSTAGL
jgi:hypothetical protein